MNRITPLNRVRSFSQTKCQKKYISRVNDRHFKHWYINLSNVSPIAAEVRLHSIGSFFDVIAKTSEEFDLLAQKEMEEVAQGYLNSLQSSTNPKIRQP